jgi:hypothetical protein
MYLKRERKPRSKITIPVYIHVRSRLLYPLVKTLAFQEKTASANSTQVNTRGYISKIKQTSKTN